MATSSPAFNSKLFTIISVAAYGVLLKSSVFLLCLRAGEFRRLFPLKGITF